MKQFIFKVCLIICLTMSTLYTAQAQMNNITVFGSAFPNFNKNYQSQAYQFGKILGQQNKTLVYGGSVYGLTGSIYNGATEANARIVNISTVDLFNLQCPVEHACRQNDTILKNSLDETKQYLFETGDAIVILPGGWTTLDEFANYVMSVQAGIQKKKPVIFLNLNHYWDNFRYQLDEMKRQNEIDDDDTDYISFIDKPRNVLSEAIKIQKQIEKNITNPKKQKITLPTKKGTLTIHY